MPRVGAGGEFQPHGGPAAAVEHRLLDRVQQVAGVVVLDGHVGVARDAEHGRGQHLAAGEQLADVGGDHVLQPGQVQALLGRAA